MHEFSVLTESLARRIESYFAEGYATGERLGSPAKLDVQRFGRTVAVKSTAEPWRNGVFCFSEAAVPQLDRMISFFEEDNAQFRFYLSQVGISEAVCRALTEKSIFPVYGSQALTYTKHPERQWHVPSAFSIEEVTEETLDVFCEAQFLGFEYPAPWRDSVKESIFSRFRRSEVHLYIVRHHNTVAGSGALILRDGLGGLMDTAVIPAHRSKGCHTALLKHRINVAGRLGCELVVSGAHYGSTSFRNQCRAGLQIAYIETTWRRIT